VVPRLGEILVRDGACTAEAVAEALQNQAIFGGRLGTNLLELGTVSEEALALALGKRTGAPALYGELPPDPAALRLVDRKVADRWEVVPFLVADRKLAVLARDPGDIQMLDEVAFATGRHVQAFVVPEARLWRMLRHSYGLEREHRGLKSQRRTPTTTPAAQPTAPGDLMEESEFQDLYGQLGTLPAPLPGAPADPVDAAGAEAALIGAPPLVDQLAGVVPAAPPVPGLAPPPPGPEPSPLSFADTVRFLEGVEDRGTIARTLLRCARSHFWRAVIFTLHHDEAHGWAGLGGGLSPGQVRALRLPLSTPGVVATVAVTRAPYVGPLPKTWANVRLLKGLGGGVPRSAALVPVVALQRVVNVIYADNGRGAQVEPEALAELVVLAARVALTWDALARRAV